MGLVGSEVCCAAMGWLGDPSCGRCGFVRV
jgi:hypothetical protein